MASEILKDLVERVHLLQERPGSWAEPDRIRTITDLALELVQSLSELEDRVRRVETRAQASTTSATRAAPAKSKAKSKPAAKPKAKAKPAAKAKPKAKSKPAAKPKKRGKAKGRR
jgi:hypothetical protein